MARRKKNSYQKGLEGNKCKKVEVESQKSTCYLKEFHDSKFLKNPSFKISQQFSDEVINHNDISIIYREVLDLLKKNNHDILPDNMEVDNTKLSSVALAEKNILITGICNGTTAINRLSASFDNYKGKYFKDMLKNEFEEVFVEFKKSLDSVILPPDSVDYDFDTPEEAVIIAGWHFPYPVLFDSFEDYETLAKNFENYIATFAFANAIYDSGQFEDSPFDMDDEQIVYARLFGIRSKAVKTDYNPDIFTGFETDDYEKINNYKYRKIFKIDYY